MTDFKFKPYEHVMIPVFEISGRINRCINDGGLHLIYSVDYVINGDLRTSEFYEDELLPL